MIDFVLIYSIVKMRESLYFDKSLSPRKAW